MTENLMLAGMAKAQRRREARDALAAKAYDLLKGEFLEALGERVVTHISTPGDSRHSQPLHEVVLELLQEEEDGHTLRQMLYLVSEMALQDVKAADGVCMSLAHRYADWHTQRLAERGAFDEWSADRD